MIAAQKGAFVDVSIIHRPVGLIDFKLSNNLAKSLHMIREVRNCKDWQQLEEHFIKGTAMDPTEGLLEVVARLYEIQYTSDISEHEFLEIMNQQLGLIKTVYENASSWKSVLLSRTTHVDTLLRFLEFSLILREFALDTHRQLYPMT